MTRTRICSLLGCLGLILLVCTVAVAAEEKAYNVELNSFEKNPKINDDEKWVDWGDLRMKKVSKNKFTLTGTFEFKRNMGDEQKLSMQVFMYDDSTQEKGAMVMNVEKPFCQFVNEDEDTYPYLQKSSDLPEQGGCPFPKGTYTIDKYELETTFLPDDAPKGDYLIELNTLDKDMPVTGLLASVTLT
ncbi:hypothetical protein KR215_005018 [Drosophila sulfurigaster]|uniref:Uncharacterized protein LOC117571367 n=1 Tax=Drosophila albomicans TaxID=7291 RepID=A0A6P8XBB6_DROAB|nr:uncharacterized protein LOC117571367 [Drosophila albomicans]XP_060663271.1 uncharacterized protein LOC132796205 [Drosophila nasuta]XP_062139597.1 uncharacterized protein LOC133848170 [Drosophila sulfurigaster albostrigata]KAH8407374.1 hypothetical protein KR215_005018 [Drosophila sulfurigaster]